MQQFYHQLFRKYITIFGSIFDNIYISRFDENGIKTQDIKIPVSYGPRDKFLARIEGDRQEKRDIALQLPRISFEMIDFDRDSVKMLNITNRLKNNGKPFNEVYTPVPYNISFELNVMTKNLEDGLQAMEQILPYFNPKMTVKAQLLDELDIDFDIPIELYSSSFQDAYDGDFLKRRIVIWTLGFTMRAHFFGPIYEPKLIKFAKVNNYTLPEMETPFVTVTTQPGLTANGQPTTKLSETINYLDIEKDDPYGFIVRILDANGEE